MDSGTDFLARIQSYSPTAAHHEQLFAEFTVKAWADPDLAAHLRHVEADQLGFGDLNIGHNRVFERRA